MMHNLDVYIIVVFYSFLLVSNSLYEVEPTDVHVTIEFNCILTTLDSLDSLPTYGFSSWKASFFLGSHTQAKQQRWNREVPRAVGNPPTQPAWYVIYRSVGMPPLLPPLTFFETILLMEEFRRPEMFQKVFQNSGITYQPQLVARISEPSTVSALGCMISQPSNPMRTPLLRGVPMVKSSFGVASAMGGPCPPTSKSVPWRWMGSKLSAAGTH